MDSNIKQLIVTGGTPLSGEVQINGAKNLATKLMIASLLTDEPVILTNAPLIGDVNITKDICQKIGSHIEIDGHTLKIHTPTISTSKIREQTSKNRLSVLAISPLLHRCGEAELPIVGGDKIGARPVNYHIEALRKMGADIEESSGGYRAKTDGLRGADINLEYPSVGATENIILAAVLAKGRTVIHNAAIEPEVTELVMMLQKMGAIIEYRAKQVMIIDGVEKLSGTEHTIIPDRLEAASFGIAAIASGGEIFVKNAKQKHLITLLNTIRSMGAGYEVRDNGILFRRTSKRLTPVEITTDIWPGFASDWQQPMAVLLTQAEGRSIINETVYENRFEYIGTLNQMGAKIKIFNAREVEPDKQFRGPFYKESAEIIGPTPLKGADIVMPDIRAGMAHLIAALIADGQSRLVGIDHLFRGYEDPLGKLKAVGAKFTTASG